jgi:thiamine-monophosphate kinase
MGSDATLRETGEFGLIDRITSGLAQDPRVPVGPGDDAAVVSFGSSPVAVTCDVLVEGRHFRRDWSTAVDVGRKAASASLADIAAMGGTTTALVVGFAAPADLPSVWAVECTAGLTAEAASAGAVLVGGDVVEAPVIMLSVTALGDLGGRPPVLRSGARPGDLVAVAGRLGWSAAGLALLTRGFRSPKALVNAHRFPEPPYDCGPRAALGGATSMIDVSDGLIADAGHVAEASGVQIDLLTEGWTIPDDLASAASAFHMDPRDWMLTGGEDHALLATFPGDAELPEGFVLVGTVVAGQAQVTVDGRPVDAPGGFAHFR